MQRASLPSTNNYRDRVARTRAGIAVGDAVQLMEDWRIPVSRFATMLGLSDRQWARLRSGSQDALLGMVESDRLLRVHAVLLHAEAVFDTHADAVAWLGLPNRALSNDTPLSLLDTDAGVHAVDDVLTRLEFGVFH